jgi:hypothetical protein
MDRFEVHGRIVNFRLVHVTAKQTIRSCGVAQDLACMLIQ